MEYTVVVTTDIRSLIDRVNNRLKAGWKLYGSMFTWEEVRFYQPMTFEETDEKN